jgi:hypothetical protein
VTGPGTAHHVVDLVVSFDSVDVHVTKLLFLRVLDANTRIISKSECHKLQLKLKGIAMCKLGVCRCIHGACVILELFQFVQNRLVGEALVPNHFHHPDGISKWQWEF